MSERKQSREKMKERRENVWRGLRESALEREREREQNRDREKRQCLGKGYRERTKQIEHDRERKCVGAREKEKKRENCKYPLINI